LAVFSERKSKRPKSKPKKSLKKRNLRRRLPLNLLLSQQSTTKRPFKQAKMRMKMLRIRSANLTAPVPTTFSESIRDKERALRKRMRALQTTFILIFSRMSV
jgi:hypothetical protein